MGRDVEYLCSTYGIDYSRSRQFSVKTFFGHPPWVPRRYESDIGYLVVYGSIGQFPLEYIPGKFHHGLRLNGLKAEIILAHRAFMVEGADAGTAVKVAVQNNAVAEGAIHIG